MSTSPEKGRTIYVKEEADHCLPGGHEGKGVTDGAWGKDCKREQGNFWDVGHDLCWLQWPFHRCIHLSTFNKLTFLGFALKLFKAQQSSILSRAIFSFLLRQNYSKCFIQYSTNMRFSSSDYWDKELFWALARATGSYPCALFLPNLLASGLLLTLCAVSPWTEKILIANRTNQEDQKTKTFLTLAF